MQWTERAQNIIIVLTAQGRRWPLTCLCVTGRCCQTDTTTRRELVRGTRWRTTRYRSSDLRRHDAWTRDTSDDANVFTSTYAHNGFVLLFVNTHARTHTHTRTVCRYCSVIYVRLKLLMLRYAGAGLSGRYSPASSIISVGPDIPTAPESPWMSDFYDSEVETDNPRRSVSRDVSSREATLERPRTTSSTSASRQPPPSPSATNYMQYRSRNILDRGPYHWPSSAPSTLQRAGDDARHSNTPSRDLFDIARRRRAGDSVGDLDRLEDWINGLLSESTQSSPLRNKPTSAATTNTQRHVINTNFPRWVLCVVVKYSPAISINA